MAVMPAMAPAHLFGLEAIDFVAGGNRGMGVFIARWRLMIGERVRRQRRGLGACGQSRGARGKSKSDFQKMAAFHDISLLAIMLSDAPGF